MGLRALTGAQAAMQRFVPGVWRETGRAVAVRPGMPECFRLGVPLPWTTLRLGRPAPFH